MSKAIANKVKNYSAEDITENNINEFIKLLDELDGRAYGDKTELAHAYDLARRAISLRSKQFEAMGELLSDKENEILGLVEQNDELEKENRELQKALSGSDASQEMLIEKKRLSDEVKSFAEEVRGLRQKMDVLVREKETISVEKAELKRKTESQQDEIQELSDRCQFLQSRIQEKTSFKEPGEMKLRKEISNLRSQIRVQKAKIDAMEDEKHSLWMDVQRLEASLRQATAEIDQASDEHQRMKRALADADSTNAKTKSECEALRLELAKISQQAEEPDSSSDFLMKTLENKVDEWKQALSEKDLEIVQLYEEIRRLQKECNNKILGPGETNIVLLSQTLKERDKQVQLLKDQLAEATQELNKSEKLLEELRSDMNRNTSGMFDRKLERIHSLQEKLKEKEQLVTDHERRLKSLDQTMQSQAAEITHLENRLRKYESGEYGLAEAVKELKSLRSQLDSKEHQLEELCRVASQAESAWNEIRLENEHLRTKLGIALDESIDLDGYRRMKRAKEEEERAVNEVLQKEIEKLEDERLELKRCLRAAARHMGQKFANENDHVDNALMHIWAAESEIPVLSEEITTAAASTNYAAQPGNRSIGRTMDRQEPEIYQARIQVLNAELGQATESIQLERQKQEEYKVRLAQVTEANVCLEAGLRELHAQLQTGKAQLKSDQPVREEQKRKSLGPSDQVAVLECPSLDKLLAALDARVLGEDLDTSRFLKSRVDHLEGANSELRRELREVRLCAAEKEVKLKYTEQRLQKSDSQFQALQLVGDNLIAMGVKDTQTLPTNLDEQASEVIQKLEEHLQSVLDELESKSQQLCRLDQELEEYRHKFALCRHRQGLLYQDFFNERQTWNKERNSMENQVLLNKSLSKEVEIYKSEMARLTESLSRLDGGDSQSTMEGFKSKLADLTREVTMLRLNEAALIKRFTFAQEHEEMLRKENIGLKSELIQLESAVSARLGYYARCKEKAAFQIANLQQTLEKSVPRADHERLIRDYERMAGKYREQMDRRACASETSSILQRTEAELQKLREEHEALKTQLSVEIERRCWFEMHIGDKEKQSLEAGARSQSQNVAQRVALLEIKELNERERANHAQIMLDTVKGSLQQLELRNAELETRVSQLTKSALDLQTTEQELRQELAEVVSKEIYSKTEALLKAAQEDILNLRHEMEQLKEIALISVSQNQTFEEHQTTRDIETESFRQRLIAIESKDDDCANLARLHRQLTRLQISEATAVRRLAAAQGRATRLENTVLRLEQRLSAVEEEQSGQGNRLRQRERRFRDTVNLLRLRFAGCVPLTEQERTIERLNALIEERTNLQFQLQEALDKKIVCEAQLDSMKERLGLGDEVRVVLNELKMPGSSRNGSSGGIAGIGRAEQALDKKISEWQSRLADMRLGESTQRRQTERLRQQVRHLETVVHTQETQLVSLEMENARLVRELDQREFQWEKREAELEEELGALEAGQNEVVLAANSIREAHQATETTPKPTDAELPDRNLPPSEQLTAALATLKRYTTQLFNQKVEIESLRKRVSELVSALRDRERENPQSIMAASSRPPDILKSSAPATISNPVVVSLRMNIDLLERRLAAKEESLRRANDLLQEAYRANEETNEHHAKAIVQLQSKLHAKVEESLNQLARAVESAGTGDNMKGTRMQANKNAELTLRIHELEDALQEQNQVMMKQIEQNRQVQRDCNLWQLRCDQTVKQAASDKEAMEATYRKRLAELKNECDRFQVDLQTSNRRISELTEEVKHWKIEATKSPSFMQRQLTDRLRAELAEKDKQQQALSKALAELRREFVSQAEQTVVASANNPVSVSLMKEPPISRKFSGRPANVQPNAPTVIALKEKANNQTLNNTRLSGSPARVAQLEAENRRLADKCQELKVQLNRLNQSRETAQAARNSGTRLQWDSRKQLETEIHKLRTQSAKVNSDMVFLQKQLELKKCALERLTRENETLRTRVQNRWGPAALSDIGAGTEYKQTRQPEDLAERVSLHKQVEDLKTEVERLRRAERISADLPAGVKTVTDQTMTFEALEIRNRIAQERIQTLEQQLLSKGFTTENKLHMEHALQEDILRLNEENLELRFELEILRVDVPRLKTRVHDLETYVDVLKAEKEALRKGLPVERVQTPDSSTMTTIKRIGESGKSTKELEQIILRLKRVLQRTQEENERLKCAPGPVSHEEMKRMKAENVQLQEELERARLAAGSRLNTKRLNTEKSMLRLSQEYENLRRSYEEVVHDREKALAELRQNHESTQDDNNED